MEALIIIQNSLFVLSLAVLYDVAYRLKEKYPALPHSVLLGVMFSMVITVIDVTPLFHFAEDYHVGYVLLVFAGLVGGWQVGIITLLIHFGLDVFVLNNTVSLGHVFMLTVLATLGYLLRLGYKPKITDYRLNEFVAMNLVVICLYLLVPIMFGDAVLLFDNPIRFGEMVITLFLVFMLAGLILRRVDTMHQKEEMVAERAEYESFLTKAISDKILMIDLDKGGGIQQVKGIFMGDKESELASLQNKHLRDWQALIHPDDLHLFQAFFMRLFTGETASAELRSKVIDGNGYEWQRVYGAPIKHPTLNVVERIYFAGKSIDAEKRAQKEHEEALLERQRVEILKAFSIQSEHQFRTPLSSIHANLYLLRKVEDRERREKYIDIIKKQADLLLELVESLSLMTQIEMREELTEYQIHMNDIVSALLATYTDQAKAKNIRLQAVLSQNLPALRGSHQFIKSSVQHLIRNAVMYTLEGGCVTVSTREAQLDKYKAIEVIVEDTGVGMNEDVLSHVFERFYRADVAQTTSGLGLGLSLVKEVAVHYGGQIKLYSTQGKGTIAIFTLPVGVPA